MRWWKLYVPAVLGLLVAWIVVFLVVANPDRRRLYAQPRKEWKQRAIAEVARLYADQGWLTNEIAGVAQAMRTNEVWDVEWYSDHLIRMTNGEWVVCSAICSKQDARIHDIFVGRASDGKWYYSTYHFCVGKMVLRMKQPSSDMEEFKKTYFLKEFDGQSDECLKKTWPAKRR